MTHTQEGKRQSIETIPRIPKCWNLQDKTSDTHTHTSEELKEIMFKELKYDNNSTNRESQQEIEIAKKSQMETGLVSTINGKKNLLEGLNSKCELA